MTEPGTAAGPKPAELLGAKHDDPDPTGPLTDYESVPDTAARRITRNAARCKKCGDVLESRHRHDFRECSCGAIMVDGGLAYIRRGWHGEHGTQDELIEELSEYADA